MLLGDLTGTETEHGAGDREVILRFGCRSSGSEARENKESDCGIVLHNVVERVNMDVKVEIGKKGPA